MELNVKNSSFMTYVCATIAFQANSMGILVQKIQHRTFFGK